MQYSFTLTAYDGAGNALWTSAANHGNVFRMAVGAVDSVFALSTQAPGQVLTAFGNQGNVRWRQSTNATRLAATPDQGVVVTDFQIDGSGHHHVHVSQLGLVSPGVELSVTFASQPAFDDIISEVFWRNGHIILSGQSVRSDGRKGVFSAEYF